MASGTDKTKPLEQSPSCKQNIGSQGLSSQSFSSEDNLVFVQARVRRSKEWDSHLINFVYPDGSATSFHTYKNPIFGKNYYPLRVISIQNDMGYSSLVNQILTWISKEENNCSIATDSKPKPIKLKVEDVRVIWDIIAGGIEGHITSHAQRCNVSLTHLSNEQFGLTLRKMAERVWKDYIEIRFATVE
jgi:hypothetical protein